MSLIESIKYLKSGVTNLAEHCLIAETKTFTCIAVCLNADFALLNRY